MGAGTVIVPPGDRRRLPTGRSARWEDRSISLIVPLHEPQELRRFELEILATPAISTVMAMA
jgi:hypothetical protein